MNKKMLLMIFLIVLVLTGCNISNRKTSDEIAGGGVLTDKVYIGTQGVKFEFMKNLPPSRIYDTTNVNILVELKNKGAYNGNGRLYLTGYDPKIVRGIDPQQTFGPLEAKTKFYPEGGIETMEFSSRSIDLPKGTDSYKPRFLLTGCYSYQTLSNAVVCVDPKFYDVSVEEKACQSKDISMGGGQGGPVSVSSVRVDPVKDKAHFKIEVVNVGGGKVVREQDCPFNLDYDDLNKVKYFITLSGQRPEKCSPSDEVRLISGRGTIFCTFRIPAENQYAYQTPLEIKLDYGYMDSISKDVEIVKIPR